MKHLIIAITLAALSATPVLAQADAKHGYNSRHHHYQHRHSYNHHNYHRHWHNNYNWVAPAIIGGAVAYGLTRPYVIEQPVIVQEPPVVYQSEPVYNGCSQWREIQQPNGTIIRERTCYR